MYWEVIKNRVKEKELEKTPRSECVFCMKQD